MDKKLYTLGRLDLIKMVEEREAILNAIAPNWHVRCHRCGQRVLICGGCR